MAPVRNDLSIYDTHGSQWWSGKVPFLRGLAALVPVRLRWFSERIGSFQGKRVLDLGCGGGFMSEALTRLGASVVGVDPSRGALDAARQHANATGLSIDYREGTGERIPLEDRSVDMVVCVDVLEHVADLSQVVREFARVLRPGGWLLFDTINRNWLATFVMITLAENVLRILPRGTHDPKMFIRPTELASSLSQANFTGYRTQGIAPVWLSWAGDPVFVRVPNRWVMYLGCARSQE